MAPLLITCPPEGATLTKTNIDDGDRRFFAIACFCRRYSVGKTAAYQLINAGLVKAVKYGARTLIPGESAEAWARSLPAFDRATYLRGETDLRRPPGPGADPIRDLARRPRRHIAP